MADDTYYSLLEISEASSSAEIKAAYLRLIREVHPDRLANAPAYWQRQAEEKAKEINEAYAALSNRENRQLYDAQLAAYRGSRSTNSGQTTSQPPTPPSPRATQQRSQASSQTQYSSGASSSSSQRPSSASQQRNTASTSAPPTNAASHSTNQSSTPATNAGQRLFLAVLCSLYGIGAGYEFLTETSNGGQALLFLLTMLSFSLCLLIYQTLIRSIFDAIGLSRIRHHVLTSVGVLALVMVAGKVANMNRDTHFRGPNDQSASNAQISQVKIINGRLSDTTVSGNSNEKYPSAYNFSGYIQNNSSAIISFIRIKIRIFDCLDTRSSVSPTSDAIESVFDPSPPSNCKSIGEEEEDDFPHAGPGQTVGFANFYFPNHPQGGLRWNYEITKMDTRSIVSVPAQRTSDVRSPQQPLQDRRAQQIDSKGESEKTTQSQPLLQTARPPGSLDNPQRPLPATTPILASSGSNDMTAQGRSEVRWRKSLSGIWVGKYNCAQGASGLTLTIAESAGGELSGVFDFYPAPGGNRFPEGSYSGAVTAGPDGTFEFKPQRWISQPPGFIAVALSGRYEVDTQQLRGNVTGAIGCTSFDLSRQSSQTRSPSVAADFSGSSASVRDTIESACSSTRLVQGSAAYNRCISTQDASVTKDPSAPNYSGLSDTDKASLESACSYARTIQGPAAYHQCINTHLAELANSPSVPDLSGLSYSDKTSLESACSYARTIQGPAAYHRCIKTQFADLAKGPSVPDISGLSYSDRNSLESACSYAKTIQGPSAYHQCITNQLAELTKDSGVPDLSSLRPSDKASLESACSYSKTVQGPAAYHRCLRSQLAALGIH